MVLADLGRLTYGWKTTWSAWHINEPDSVVVLSIGLWSLVGLLGSILSMGGGTQFVGHGFAQDSGLSPSVRASAFGDGGPGALIFEQTGGSPPALARRSSS